jgi:hypothetical protein
MGTSSTVEEFAAKIEAYAAALPKAGAAALVAAAKAYEEGIDRRLVGATGGDRRLSGVGPGGAELRTTTTVGPTEAAIRLTGPWVFVERDTRRHDIRARGAGGRRRGGAQALHFGGQFFAAAHGTGGSRASYPFEVGAAESEPVAMAAFVAVHDAALGAVFGAI